MCEVSVRGSGVDRAQLCSSEPTLKLNAVVFLQVGQKCALLRGLGERRGAEEALSGL